jgi:hypothetical protein
MRFVGDRLGHSWNRKSGQCDENHFRMPRGAGFARSPCHFRRILSSMIASTPKSELDLGPVCDSPQTREPPFATKKGGVPCENGGWTQARQDLLPAHGRSGVQRGKSPSTEHNDCLNGGSEMTERNTISRWTEPLKYGEGPCPEILEYTGPGLAFTCEARMSEASA